ncbi:Chorismate mutase AroH [bioreactor metagenome]|uniref:Chorismate mutase AroH n=1 Tax=bioreactor metagenome TaxID=1076179 RepID=A0A645HB11_9ZZZZ
MFVAVEALLQEILRVNPGLKTEDIASAWFTVTDDLQIAYPAAAARRLGWTEVPLMCAREIVVPGSLHHCVRVLLHWNTERSQAEIRHVYLNDAVSLRPDLTHEK